MTSKIFTTTIASAASTAGAVQLGDWETVLLEVSTMSTNAAISVYGSTDGSTYKAVHERVNTATVQYQALVVQTNTVNCIVPLPKLPPYVQLRCSAVVNGGVSFKIICKN